MACLKCSKVFNTNQDLKRHLARKIKCDNKIECNKCKKEFKTNQNLDRHLNNKKDCKYLELEQRIEILELKLENANLRNLQTINNTVNNNITNNYYFGDEDLKHITKKILETELMKIVNEEINITKERLLKYKELGVDKLIRSDLLHLYSILTKLIYFNKPIHTMKKEDNKYYIKMEDWEEIELEKLNIKVLQRQQKALTELKTSTLINSDDRRFAKLIENYFYTEIGNEIKTCCIDELDLSDTKKKVLSKLLNYELEII
jgi:hypothetical protein